MGKRKQAAEGGHRGKKKQLVGKWQAVDIPEEVLFGLEDAEGFVGIQVLEDYSDNFLPVQFEDIAEPLASGAVGTDEKGAERKKRKAASRCQNDSSTLDLPAKRKKSNPEDVKKAVTEKGVAVTATLPDITVVPPNMDAKDKSAKGNGGQVKKRTKGKGQPAAAPVDAPVAQVVAEDKKVALPLSAMSAWTSLELPEPLLQSLADLGFETPTQIQTECIPLSMKGQDVMGAAETGSGKTLAFALPILARLLPHKGEGPQALVVAPSRELAFQVRDHFVAAAKHTGLKVVALVGGLAIPKQRRLLAARPEIIVATPGRLWELITLAELKFETLKGLRFLVIDEADRMVEDGRFRELRSILNWMNQRPEEDRPLERQTMIFSATLTVQPHVDKWKKKKQKGNAKAGDASSLDSLDTIFSICGLRADHAVINLSSLHGKHKLAEGLVETRVVCPTDDKDLFLWYFLLKYPGKAVVFVNSIDCIRRLNTIMQLVNLKPLILHGQMQQRQRLKNLDRFRNNEQGILLATDVAARGIDVQIDHVIHYQFPRDVQTYIHRSGRTARASSAGLSVALISPEDNDFYKEVIHELNRDHDLATFPVELAFFPDLRKRMSLALKIDTETRMLSKISTHNDWFLKNAQEMDLELDEDLLDHSTTSDDTRVVQRKLQAMKAELAALLAQPLYKNRASRFVSAGGHGMDHARLVPGAKGTALQASTKKAGAKA